MKKEKLSPNEKAQIIKLIMQIATIIISIIAVVKLFFK